MEAQIANLSNKKKRKNEIRKIETRAPFTETETLSLPSTLSFTIDRNSEPPPHAAAISGDNRSHLLSLCVSQNNLLISLSLSETKGTNIT
jgi:hypothetical protein